MMTGSSAAAIHQVDRANMRKSSMVFSFAIMAG
jgi:hypothetical protein